MLTRTQRTATLAAVLVMLSSGAAHAQYSGPSSAAPAAPTGAALTSIDALKDAKDDQKVTLTGTLKEKVGSEKYTFTDGTHDIRVEIDSEDFPTEKIDDKTKVEITGEVEKEYFQSPEIDVDTVKIVK